MKEIVMATGSLNLKTNWGPFSSTYLGISHILDAARGTMAEIALFAGRRNPESLIIPDTTFDYVQSMADGDRRTTVSAMPEKVSPDYSSYSLRYFLDPDGDTASACFTVESDERMCCEITFDNTSDEQREYHYGLGLLVADPRKKVRLQKRLQPWWIPARNYTSIEAYQKTFGLGCRQCLTRVFCWGVENEVLAQAFGGWNGDRVTYRTTLPEPLQNGYIYFRYIKYGVLNHRWELLINGQSTIFSFPQTRAIPGGGWGKNRDAYNEWRLLRIPVGRVTGTDITLELRPVDAPGNDMARIWLDGMLFSEGLTTGDEGSDELLPTTLIDEPLCENGRVELETSAGSSSTFKIVIQDDPVRRVTVITGDGMQIQAQNGNGSFLGSLRKRFSLPDSRMERDSNAGQWGSVDIAPVIVPARSQRTLCFKVVFDAEPANKAAAGKFSAAGVIPPRGPYAEMIAHLRDILLFNVNYPLNLSGFPSPFYVPAKYFPIPYSWDGGFIAVGMSTFVPDIAMQQACYFMADAEYDFPCLFCGSPVPTPLYALWDVYQATQDLSILSRAYAGAKRMYDFYLGRTPGSAVNAAGDGMLSTYAYYYNLGIDDHPIQRMAEKEQLTSKGLYSIILMPQMLRIARIMRNIARLLKYEIDAEQYHQDADLLSGIIDNRMWDEKSGLYGWLCRTDGGIKPVILDGCAGDRSACAFLPLFAGQTAHKDRLIRQMMDPSRFLTPFGISSVDMSAPSYSPHGYWNGGVWPVLQWYIWRGLLESGEPVLARQVAESILSTWQNFFEREHYFGEHFMIAPEQMNGAPNFGGLSAVLLPMHAAYFTAYQVTACYDVIVLKKSADYKTDTLSLLLSAPFLSSASYDLLVNMGNGGTRYECIVNGKLYGEFVSDEYGHLSLRLPRPDDHEKVLFKPAVNSMSRI